MTILSNEYIASDLKPGRHYDGGNLCLRVNKAGGKSWSFIWKAHGVKREVGLGSYTGKGGVKVTLEMARRAAKRMAIQVYDGANPVADRKQARAAAKAANITFAELLEQVIKNEATRWKADAEGNYGNEADWRQALNKDASKLMGRPAANGKPAVASMRIARVDEDMVMSVLKPIWTTKCETADRIRYRIKLVIERAKTIGAYPNPNPASKDNVVAHLGKQPLTTGKKLPSLAFEKVPGVLVEMGRKHMSSLASIFCTLTAVRTDECRLAKWTEIDWENRLWVIPSERMKVVKDNDRGGDHVVPLSDAAMEILREAFARKLDDNEHLFTGYKVGLPLGTTALNDRLTKSKAKGGLNLLGEATQHGMRASFRTWASRQGFNDNASELCLAHTIGTETTRAYNRDEMLGERAKILQAWGEHCLPTNVVELRAAA